LILGPAAEQHLRRTLAISQGDWSVFATHPLSAALLLTSVAVASSGMVADWSRRRAARRRIESGDETQ